MQEKTKRQQNRKNEEINFVIHSLTRFFVCLVFQLFIIHSFIIHSFSIDWFIYSFLLAHYYDLFRNRLRYRISLICLLIGFINYWEFDGVKFFFIHLFTLVQSVVQSLTQPLFLLPFYHSVVTYSFTPVPCCAGATAAHPRPPWTREAGATAATTNHPHDARTPPTTSTASARQRPSSHDASRTDDTSWRHRRRGSYAANADDWRSSVWDNAAISGGGSGGRRDGRRFYDRSAAYDVMAGTATPSTGTGTVTDTFFRRLSDLWLESGLRISINLMWIRIRILITAANPWLFEPPDLHCECSRPSTAQFWASKSPVLWHQCGFESGASFSH